MNIPRKGPGQVATLVGAAVLVAHCFVAANCSLSAPYPSRSLYTLDAGTVEPPPSERPKKNVALRVRRLIAIEPFNNQTFVYRTSANTIRTDYYNTFAAPPADMITSQLVQWLRSSRTFAAVTDSGGALSHQWALEGRIQDLSIDSSNPKSVQAVISMQIVILDETAAATRVLFEKSYTQRTPLSAIDPATAAAGWSTACRALFLQITDDLASVSSNVRE